MKNRKVIFITGTSRGLGKTIFDKLTSEGHIVYGASRSPLPNAKNQFQLDVTDYGKCNEVINSIVEKEGRIDVIINNVGGHLIGAAIEVSNEELKSQVDMNFYSAVHTIKAVLPIYMRQKSGQIISISSLMGTVALPYSSAYCAAKFALEGYLEALRLELLPLGIFVSMTETGYINTGIQISSPQKTVSEFAELRKSIKRQMEENSPTGINPEKVAEVVVSIIHSSKPKLRFKIDRMTKGLSLFKALSNQTFFEKSILKTFNLPLIIN
jgi:short-subunit dehydrogenase